MRICFQALNLLGFVLVSFGKVLDGRCRSVLRFIPIKHVGLILMFILIEKLASAQPVGAASFVLSPLSINQDIAPGCGTLVYLKGVDSGDSPHLGWTGGAPKIRLNGRTLTLQLVEEKWQHARRDRSSRGDRGLLRLSGEDLKVEIKPRLTRVCARNMPECESEDFDGVMTLKSGEASRSFDILGNRGC